MTRQDILDWKEHPITQLVFNVLQDEVDKAKYVLSKEAGKDPLQDRWYCGVIHGITSVLNVDAED